MPTRRTHLVPTHLKVPETVLTVAGLNLSVQQFLLMLFGLAASYQVWTLWQGFASLLGWQILRWGTAALPILLALALAFVRIAARPLLVWGLIVLRYLLRPRHMVWRSIRLAEPQAMAGLVEERREV
jgi:hypothetical protein